MEHHGKMKIRGRGKSIPQEIKQAIESIKDVKDAGAILLKRIKRKKTKKLEELLKDESK